MNFSSSTHTTHTATVTLTCGTDVELVLPIEPDSVMMYKDRLQRQVGNTITIGYLAHDSDCQNPLEDGDGYGKILVARRHSSDLPEFYKALGLDSSGSPDYEFDDDEAVEKECDRQLRLMADAKHPDGSFTLVKIHGDLEGMGFEQGEGSGVFQHVMENIEEIDLEDYFDFDAIRKALWEKGRADGTIGNKYAISLDVYEHSGISYSLSGGGMQCRFDTARGGALWVPNDVCEEEIKSRGPVYQKGKIVSSQLRTKHQYNVRTYESFGLFDEVVHPPFDTFGEAYQYLKELNWEGYVQPLEDAEHDAARELAKQAADIFTEWSNGNCFGYVVATFELPEEVEDGQEIDYEDHDSCWGFIGDDDAYSNLKEAFDAGQ